MSFKVKDPKDPTKEIEVFTEAELAEAKKGTAPDAAALKVAQDAAIAEYKKNNPDKTGEVDTLKNTLAQKQAELEAAIALGGGEAGRDAQIERLRVARDAAQTALTTQVGALTEKIANMEKTGLVTARDAALSRLGVHDKEAREKVLVEFEKYNSADTSAAGVESRLAAAITLSGVKVEAAPSNMDMAGGQGGQRGTGGGHTGPVKVADNAVKIGNALGNKPEELQALADKKAGITK